MSFVTAILDTITLTNRKEYGLNMSKATYEFHYVSRKQKVQLILWKAAVILFMLSFLATLVYTDDNTLGRKLSDAAAVLQAVFCYINLMRVQVEVQELFQPPVQWKAYEFFWLGTITFVISFFV